ncbi:putative ABC transporter permease [Candidatus Saccharibacteria bacterium]|nr:putative ABC transporter permease [Candidatus Saccharibacteria bacterium]
MAKLKQRAKATSVFAEGLCFEKLFFVFIIGSVFGDYYERVINLVSYSWGGVTWFWERRSGVIYGPFSVIYGLGAVVMILTFIWLPNKIVSRKKLASDSMKSAKSSAAKDSQPAVAIKTSETPLKWWQILIMGGLLGGMLEYFLGVLQEIFTGTSSWNYSDHWMNIGAKTSPFVMLVWGVICVLLVKFAYPFLSKCIEKIPRQIGEVLFWILLIFICLDILISFSAVLKMNLRHHNVPSFTPYGQFLDSTYPDEKIHKAYPNMVNV